MSYFFTTQGQLENFENYYKDIYFSDYRYSPVDDVYSYIKNDKGKFNYAISGGQYITGRWGIDRSNCFLNYKQSNADGYTSFVYNDIDIPACALFFNRPATPKKTLSLPFDGFDNCDIACLWYGSQNNFSTFARYPEANSSNILYKKNQCECDPVYKNLAYEKDSSSFAQINGDNTRNGYRIIGGTSTMEFDNLTLEDCSKKNVEQNGDGFTSVRQPILSFEPDEGSFASINGNPKHAYTIMPGDNEIKSFNISPNECYWKNEDLNGDGYTTNNFTKGAVYPMQNENSVGKCDVYISKNKNKNKNDLKGKCIVHFHGN